MHLIHRGVTQGDLFLDDIDRRQFLLRLVRACDRRDWTIVAWTLMTNHVHIVARRGASPTAAFARSYSALYARDFNRRHGRSGHVFEGPYRRIPIHSDEQLLACIRYVHLNPVVAALVPSLEALELDPWTGHRGLMGGPVLPTHDTAFVLSMYGECPTVARQRVREHMVEGLIHRPW